MGGGKGEGGMGRAGEEAAAAAGVLAAASSVVAGRCQPS